MHNPVIPWGTRTLVFYECEQIFTQEGDSNIGTATQKLSGRISKSLRPFACREIPAPDKVGAIFVNCIVQHL